MTAAGVEEEEIDLLQGRSSRAWRSNFAAAARSFNFSAMLAAWSNSRRVADADFKRLIQFGARFRILPVGVESPGVCVERQNIVTPRDLGLTNAQRIGRLVG